MRDFSLFRLLSVWGMLVWSVVIGLNWPSRRTFVFMGRLILLNILINKWYLAWISLWLIVVYSELLPSLILFNWNSPSVWVWFDVKVFILNLNWLYLNAVCLLLLLTKGSLLLLGCSLIFHLNNVLAYFETKFWVKLVFNYWL